MKNLVVCSGIMKMFAFLWTVYFVFVYNLISRIQFLKKRDWIKRNHLTRCYTHLIVSGINEFCWEKNVKF